MAEEKKAKGAEAKKGADGKKGAESKKAKTAASAGEAGGAHEKAELPTGPYTPRLKKHFEEVVRPALTEQFGYKNALEVPTIDKIVLNMGVGEAVNDTKKVTAAAGDLALIAGQKPVVTRARQEIDYDKAESILGLDVIVCTTAKTDEEARALLKAFNFPFRQ